MTKECGSTFIKRLIEIQIGENIIREAASRDLIIAGQAKPGIIVSHRIGFDAAPAALRKFDERKDGYIKIVLDPKAA